MLKVVLLSLISSFVFISAFSQSYLGYTTESVYLLDTAKNKIIHTGKGDAIILTSLEKKGKMLKVIHVKSKKTGYVLAKNVTIEKNVTMPEKDLLETLQTSEIKDPLLKIHNESKNVMTLYLNNQKYQVEPHQTATIKIKAGKYASKVITPNNHPIYNLDRLEDYKLYTWNYFLN